MRLSNKSTFSLVCIILLLVFVAVPVMAHPPADDGTKPGNLDHDHPLLETLPAQNLNPGTDPGQDSDVTDPGEPEITPHNHHPMVTSITLKAGDNVRGTMVAVPADVADTTDVNESAFTIVVTFDRDIVTADNTDVSAIPDFDAANPATGAQLEGGDLAHVLELVDLTPTTGTTGIAVNRVEGNAAQYEIVVTPAQTDIPNADGDDATTNDNTVTFKIRVNADTVFSHQTRGTPPGGLTSILVPGGGNFESDVYAFTLVSELPEEEMVDDVDPTVTVTAPTAPESDGKLNFAYSVSDDTGKDVLITAAEVEVTNGMVDSVTATHIIVVPSSDTSKVTVTVKAGAVTDAADNTSDEMMASFTPTGYVPSITITSADEKDADGDATGKIVFTIDFSEAVMSFNVSHIVTENAPELRITDLMMAEAADTPDDVAVRYMLTVDPVDDTKDVKITIRAGVLMTTGANPNPFDLATKSHKLTAPTPDPDDPTIGADNTSPEITVPKNGFVVVVRDTTEEDPDVGQDAILRAYDPDITLAVWADMPDLENLFDTDSVHGAGALVLMETKDGGVDPGTVGISEIMSAIDLSKLGQAIPQRHAQWIELHNLNDAAVKVKLSYVKGAKIIGDEDGKVDFLRGNLAKPYLDAVTNAFEFTKLREQKRTGVWSLPSKDGNPRTGTNFVSAARTGKFSFGSKDGDQYNQRYTYTGGATKSRDGRDAGHWAESTVSYARGSHALGSGLGNVFYDYVGTPGRVNTFDAGRPTQRDARTDVPASPIIINEVANRDDANSQYEWIELKNVHATETIDLNNYQISILTAVDKDEPFIFLPNNDKSKIPPGGVLLLVDSDPFGDDDHPLAVGWKIGKNEGNQVSGLSSIGINGTSKEGRYLVVPFGGKNNKFINGLPDDGNFILVVRKPDSGNNEHSKGDKGRAELGKDDLDKITDIAGYAGTLTKDDYSNTASKTDLWPLKEQRTGNLISDRNKLTVNTVHYRARNGRNGLAGVGTTHNDRNEGQVAYQHAGYTGIGYKRHAANSAVHGGTPGYDNGARKGRVSDLATTKLVISEIMLSQGAEGARTTLPQWIEIYNPSPHPVGLGGWKLIIENPRDPIRTINLGGGTVKTILSKQTILVVSGSARDFGSGNLVSAAAKVFPATRVYNVYDHQKNEFNMDSRFDPILNQEAFHITLIDGSALDLGNAEQKAIADDPTKSLRVGGSYFTISDVIGNLDGNPRTNDTPEDNGKMAFPMGMTEDGDRTSLIRVFDNGVARDGTGAVKPMGGTDGVDVARMKGIDSKYSWVHAADTDFAYADRNIRATTWYGARSDSGTPLNRIGQILPVSLSHFRPELENGEVVIRWTTESELDNAGFNILRSDTRNGEFKQVNAEMIQGNGTTGERSTYKWVDATAKPGVVYYYQIEDVSFAGERQTLQTTKLKGYISAVGKATTTWGDIKEVQ